jgi:hypothetical protein
MVMTSAAGAPRQDTLGAAGFLTKPVDFEHLKEQLRQLPAAAD